MEATCDCTRRYPGTYCPTPCPVPAYAAYAMSGTGVDCPTRCPVLRWAILLAGGGGRERGTDWGMLLRGRYEMPGTEVGYNCTRRKARKK
eukprot:921805-Rhodomonas_salina.3